MAPVLQIEEARERLERMLGKISDWSGLTRLLPLEWQGGRAAALGPGLDPAGLPGAGPRRQGGDCSRWRPFEEIYVRDRDQAREPPGTGAGSMT